MHTAEREWANLLEEGRTLPLEDTSLADVARVRALGRRPFTSLTVISLAWGA